MVRKKIDNINYISDKTSRLGTYLKRKRGFLKKAIEFSKLCGLDMFLVILDSDQNRLIEYRSSESFGVSKVKKIKSDRKTNGT